MTQQIVTRLPTAEMAKRGILTRDQLASELDLSEQTMRNWELAGMPYVKEGKVVMYHVPAVIKWLMRGKKYKGRR